MDTIRLIRHPPSRGSWNMAVDESLLESAAAEGHSCWRFYAWSPATLSLGYFQSYRDRDQHPGSLQLDVVRRASGGGAIVHDQELTYSFAVPAGRRFAAMGRQRVTEVHRALGRALSNWQIAATVCGRTAARRPKDPPFLCFQRRAAEDLLLGNHKIAGSAQRQRRKGLLLHGSVLLAASTCAAELPGINDLASRPVTPDQLVEAWLEHLAVELQGRFQPDTLGALETDRARQLESARYASSHWTQKR